MNFLVRPKMCRYVVAKLDLNKVFVQLLAAVVVNHKTQHKLESGLNKFFI